MTRRIYTYAAANRLGHAEPASRRSAQVIVDVSMLLFVIDVARSLRKGEPAGENPGAHRRSNGAPQARRRLRTALPSAGGCLREPLWSRDTESRRTSRGLSTQTREGLVTTVLDALPDARYVYPVARIWPVVAALHGGVVADLVDLSVQATRVGNDSTAIAFIAWYWPNRRDTAEELALEKKP